MKAGRPLTLGERALATSVFGGAIDYDRVRIHAAKWWPLQPSGITMAPDGHIWFHPKGGLYRDDFSTGSLADQGLFIHEMTHVWQAQNGGRWYLPLMRHPFCRYRYRFVPGRPFGCYGLEQQAEIVRHLFLARRQAAVPGAPFLSALEGIVAFRPNPICADSETS